MPVGNLVKKPLMSFTSADSLMSFQYTSSTSCVTIEEALVPERVPDCIPDCVPKAVPEPVPEWVPSSDSPACMVAVQVELAPRGALVSGTTVGSMACLLAATNALANSCAVAKRTSRDLSSTRAKTASNADGSLGLSKLGGVGVCPAIC